MNRLNSRATGWSRQQYPVVSCTLAFFAAWRTFRAPAAVFATGFSTIR